MNSIPKIPTPVNEPVLSYAPGTPERADLKRTLKELSGRQLEIPLVIGGKDVHTGRTVDVVMPHCHRHVLAKAHQAGPAELQAAIAAAREAWRDWSAWGFEQRAAVFLKAADLLATRYRPIVNGATMLGQSKTAHQAEIDAACELIDFFRFNVHYAERIYAEQPLSVSGVWNYLDYRPLEGFVYAITPFNFTSIGGNLPTAPAIMGNTVVWKPAATAVLSNYFIMRLLAEAGLPPGVINFVPGPSVQVSERVLADRAFAGIHFTCSAAAPTTRTATSSIPPSSKPRTRRIARCVRRSSGRSCRSTSTPPLAGLRRCASWTTRRPMRSLAQFSRRTGAPSRRPRTRSGSPPVTSTSTTSPPVRWWDNSRSAGRAPAARTTRRGASSS